MAQFPYDFPLPASSQHSRGIAMFVHRLAVLMFLLVPIVPLYAQDRSQLVGPKEWKVVKSEEAPPGTKLLFAEDGKLVLTFTADGKARTVTGSYALAGNQLTLTLPHDGKNRVEVRTIKKLTDTILITEDKNHKLEELTR
jgi:uncharacterized protein (TIGR03066 family)